MFGNVLNKGQIQLLVAEDKIRISNFSLDKFRLAHYPLTPAKAAIVGDLDAQGRRLPDKPHDFKYEKELVFDPHEHRLIEIKEHVQLPDGISGHFVPSSSLITNGFGLHAGKIDPGYGKIRDDTQKLVFGVQNLLDRPNTFSIDSRFVYMYLLDFRALGRGGVDFNEQEIRRMQMISQIFNRVDDDGVGY